MTEADILETGRVRLTVEEGEPTVTDEDARDM